MTTLHISILRLCAVSSFLFPCFGFVSTKTNSAGAKLRQPSFRFLSSHDDDGEAKNEGSSSLRRRIILSVPATLLLPSTTVNAAETPTEAIRLLSAKTIPGLGPPDIYYPPYFVGKWRVTRVITSSDDNFWSGVNLPVQFSHEVRFVPYDAGKEFSGDDNPNNVPAIADRSFNERSYYASLSENTKSMPSIQNLNWVPTNPNVLSLAYTDGSSKEIKVTKRSSDVSKDGNGVFSSEFRRMTDVPASTGVAGGIPSIYKSRLLMKWKPAANVGDGGVNLIEGIEIMYNEQGTLGEKNVDSMFGGGGKNGALSSLYGGDTKDLSDWRSTKTKILMERI